MVFEVMDRFCLLFVGAQCRIVEDRVGCFFEHEGVAVVRLRLLSSCGIYLVL